MQETVENTVSVTGISNGTNNGLHEIKEFIEQKFKVRAKNYGQEMHRIDALVKAKFPMLSKRYNLLVVLSVFRKVIYHNDHPIRLIGHLYEPLVLALLNGKSSVSDEDMDTWITKAEQAGFRGATYRKLTDVYDALVKKPGSNLKPRSKATSSKKTVEDVVFKVLTTDPDFSTWKDVSMDKIDLPLLHERVKKAGVEYDRADINMETVRKALGRLKKRVCHERHTVTQRKAPHRIRK